MSKCTSAVKWEPKRERWYTTAQKDGQRKFFYSSLPGRKGQAEVKAKADAWLETGVNPSGERIEKLYALVRHSGTDHRHRQLPERRKPLENSHTARHREKADHQLDRTGLAKRGQQGVCGRPEQENAAIPLRRYAVILQILPGAQAYHLQS